MAYGYDTQYDDLTTRIKNNANSYTAPTYQNGSNMVGQITSDLVRQQDPIRKAETDRINTQANQSRSALQEYLANKGQRGGQATARLVGLQQGRNTDLANMNANYTSAAMSQAPTYANLSLNERAQIQGQQNTTANQLASLLGQRISADQAGAGLTGQYNGQSTLASQQLAAQIAQNNAANAISAAGLTGQYNGQQTLAGQAQTSDIANQQFNQRLALQQALQNWILGKGQITDTFTDISGYNVGDALKKLLAGYPGLSIA